MELRAYLNILWRRKWIIAVTFAVTMAVVVAGTLMATPTYAASTTVQVAMGTSGQFDYSTFQESGRLIETYKEIAVSGPVIAEVARQLGLNAPPRVTAAVVANTELIKITAEGQSPALARDAANIVADLLITRNRERYGGSGKAPHEILGEQLARVENELAQARRDYENLVVRSPNDAERLSAVSRTIAFKETTYARLLDQYEQVSITDAIRANAVSVIEPAALPLAQAKPNVGTNLGLGSVVGLAGGLALAFVIENLDRRLYSTEQVEEAAGVSALGRIPPARRRRQITLFDGASPQAEAFRRLQTRLAARNDGFPLHMQTLLITSAQPGEGKTTVVVNLAQAMARSGQKVLVVDGDLRRPTLHKVFGLPNEIGLSSVLKQEGALKAAMQRGSMPGIKVLTSGPASANPAELLGSCQLTTVMAQLSEEFDYVLVDAPPFLTVADAAVLAPTTDGVILVVENARDRKDEIQAVCHQLAEVRARVIGVVVNRAPQNGSYGYYAGAKQA